MYGHHLQHQTHVRKKDFIPTVTHNLGTVQSLTLKKSCGSPTLGNRLAGYSIVVNHKHNKKSPKGPNIKNKAERSSLVAEVM